MGLFSGLFGKSYSYKEIKKNTWEFKIEVKNSEMLSLLKLVNNGNKNMKIQGTKISIIFSDSYTAAEFINFAKAAGII